MGKIQGSGEYDVGFATTWSADNYGGALTQYSMYRVIKDFGLSVLMIERPMTAERKPKKYPVMYRFSPYLQEEIEPPLPHLKAMHRLNDKCQMFMVGSDQLFNNYLYNQFGRFVTMDWVQDNKRKVGYAISFGFDYIFGSEFDRAEIQRCLNKFDAVSVREISGVDLLRREFGVHGCFVLDPVFLCDTSRFYELSKRAIYSVPEDSYYFAYILDPDEKKQAALEEIEKSTHKKVVVVSDAERTIEDTMSRWGFPTLDSAGIKVEEWLKLLINSDGIITDSFHGTCFALVFKKNFITIANKIRGVTRFDSILDISNQKERLLFENGYRHASELLQTNIDYNYVNKELGTYKEKSLKWLDDNLLRNYGKKGLSDYDKLNMEMDVLEDDLFARIKALNEEAISNQYRIKKLIDRRRNNVHNSGKR